ncbi:MAG TPA: PEP-CTERM sorting domain-containing protein [Tepidisphaeraceae bacterium]|nr:PEP-CTERM sorting domain-containing protein [Tepidisphaeraceae bacterium]
MQSNRSHIVRAAALATVLVSTSAFAQTIDGSRDPSYGAALAVQTVGTQFGNSTLGDVIQANGSELAAAYGRIADGTLYLMFTGNLESNYNKIDIFIDSTAGEGQNQLRGDNPDVDFNNLNRMGNDGTNNGLKFDADFAADHFLTASVGANGPNFEMFSNYADLRTAGGGNGFYTGSSGPASAPFAHITGYADGNPANPALGLEWGLNNSNTAGVPDFGGSVDPLAAAAVTTGVEVKIPLGFLNDSISDLKVLAFINGSSHDFLSNQFLGGLEAGTPNPGEPRAFDLSTDGSSPHFFTVTATGTNLNAWTGQPTGNWSNGSRWSQGTSPNSANATAVLASGTSPVIDLDVPVTLNRMRVSSSYTINNGSNTLTFGGLNFNAVVVTGGTTVINSNVALAKNVQFDVATGASLRLTGGVTYNDRYVEKVGGGSLEVRNVRTNALGVYGGTLKVTAGGGNTNVSSLRSLFTTAGASLDLTNNGLVVPYDDPQNSPVASFIAKVVAGELVSSLGSAYTVGIIDNQTLATPLTVFMDQGVTNTTVLIRGTRKGDANLSGNVDFADLLLLAQNYDPAGEDKTWNDGDSNYDGTVDFDDLLPVAQNYGLTSFASDSEAALGMGATGAFAADWQFALASVPEPTTLSVLGGIGMMALARRRRA